MTKEEYEDWWSGGETLPSKWISVPCTCGRNDCPGWRMQGPKEREHRDMMKQMFPGVLT